MNEGERSICIDKVQALHFCLKAWHMHAEALILRDFVAALQMLTLVPGSPEDQEV